MTGQQSKLKRAIEDGLYPGYTQRRQNVLETLRVKAVQVRHTYIQRQILSLPLIQDGQLSVSGERMCTILVNRFED